MLRRMSSRRSEMKKKLYIKTLEEKVQRLAYQAAYLSAQVTLLQVKRHHCSDWKLKLSSLFIIFCVVNSLLFILVYLWMTITIFEKFFFFLLSRQTTVHSSSKLSAWNYMQTTLSKRLNFEMVTDILNYIWCLETFHLVDKHLPGRTNIFMFYRQLWLRNSNRRLSRWVHLLKTVHHAMEVALTSEKFSQILQVYSQRVLRNKNCGTILNCRSSNRCL